MPDVILFGTGSSLLLDVEESLHRAGHHVIAGVRNRPGACHMPEGVAILQPEKIGVDMLRIPFLVPLFTPGHRQAAEREAALLGLLVPFCLVDPSVAAPRRMTMGPGGYVNAGCSLGSSSSFGAFALVNRGASIGHHVRFGAFVSIGPGAILAGYVTIGDGVMVGAGSTILPGIAVGDNAVVAAGAVVTRDVAANTLVAGHPARFVRTVAGYKGLRVT